MKFCFQKFWNLFQTSEFMKESLELALDFVHACCSRRSNYVWNECELCLARIVVIFQLHVTCTMYVATDKRSLTSAPQCHVQTFKTPWAVGPRHKHPTKSDTDLRKKISSLLQATINFNSAMEWKGLKCQNVGVLSLAGFFVTKFSNLNAYLEKSTLWRLSILFLTRKD